MRGGKRGRRAGPKRAPDPEERRRWTEERRERAHEELLEVRVDPRATYPRLEVANPLRGTRYYVHLPSYPAGEELACECTDFSQRGLGTCKHVEASRFWLAGHPGAFELHPAPEAERATGDPWAEADRRRAEATAAGAPLLTAARAAGALLFEAERPPREGRPARSRGAGKGSARGGAA